MFLNDYVKMMKPVCQALDILPGDKSVSMGYFIPTIAILKDKRIKKKANASSAAITALADALIDGLDRRFARYLNNGEMIAAALLHPCFRKGWPINDTQMQAGKFHNALTKTNYSKFAKFCIHCIERLRDCFLLR